MKFINKLEKKYGKYAVENLIKYVLIAYAIGYVVYLINPTLYDNMQLDPALVCKGQVWRLFTWVCTVPQSFSIFIIFMFMFYYWIGSTLERYWGTFRYNLYIISGYLFMTVGAMLIYLVTGLILGFENAVNLSMSTYYMNLASFLAFATLFPDVQVYFMMILPIKIKWLAIVDGVYLGYEVIYYLTNMFNKVATVNEAAEKLGVSVDVSPIYSTYLSIVFSIIFSVLNFLIFFALTKKGKRTTFKQTYQRRVYTHTVRDAEANESKRNNGISKHKCAICGKTEADGDDIVFRFCSKCNGNYEYCQDHLFTHVHKE